MAYVEGAVAFPRPNSLLNQPASPAAPDPYLHQPFFWFALWKTQDINGLSILGSDRSKLAYSCKYVSGAGRGIL